MACTPPIAIIIFFDGLLVHGSVFIYALEAGVAVTFCKWLEIAPLVHQAFYFCPCPYDSIVF
ncbi:hypothetical protein DSUL_60252 [Desulfovibrionales bacterium]